MFYAAFIESVLTFAVSCCWFGNLSVKSKNLWRKIVNMKKLNLNDICHESEPHRKLRSLLDSQHPLYCEFNLLPLMLSFYLLRGATNTNIHLSFLQLLGFLNKKMIGKRQSQD